LCYPDASHPDNVEDAESTESSESSESTAGVKPGGINSGDFNICHFRIHTVDQ